MTGDQPQAVEKLVEGIADGLKYQTLMGVTGSGKTFTMANLIQRVQKPTLVISHNKTLAAQLHGEFKEFFPENAVEYDEAMRIFYNSEVFEKLRNPETGLYLESPAFVYGYKVEAKR